jgi:hypothetical protein
MAVIVALQELCRGIAAAVGWKRRWPNARCRRL